MGPYAEWMPIFTIRLAPMIFNSLYKQKDLFVKTSLFEMLLEPITRLLCFGPETTRNISNS